MKLFLMAVAWLGASGLFCYFAGCFFAFGLRSHDEKEQAERVPDGD